MRSLLHLLTRGGILSLCGRERIRAFPSHLKRRRSPQERREELQSQAPFPKSPGCLSPFQRNLFSLHCVDFQAEDRLTPLWHVLFFSIPKYLLRICYVQGLVLKSGDSAMEEANILCPSGGEVDGPLRESDDI